MKINQTNTNVEPTFVLRFCDGGVYAVPSYAMEQRQQSKNDDRSYAQFLRDTGYFFHLRRPASASVEDFDWNEIKSYYEGDIKIAHVETVHYQS